MYWNHRDMSGWDWFAMSSSTLVLWALLITVAVLLFRTLGRAPEEPHPSVPAGPAPGPESPERLLAERFARGDIDEDEYRRRLAVLRAEHPGGTEHTPSR